MQTLAATLIEMGRERPYAETQPLHVAEVELDPPGPGEVLMAVRAAGLCHSDLSVINGSRPRPTPMVLGHEAAGEVLELGAGVTDLRPGDRVVFSFVPMCGRCEMCSIGRPVLCEPGSRANGQGVLLGGAKRFHGADGTPLNHHSGVSAFSHLTVSSRESLVKVETDISWEQLALFGCAVLTGVGAVMNTARVQAGFPVAVFGLGGVGLSAILGAAAVGAWPIVAVDLLDAKLELAKTLGASHAVNAGQADWLDQVREITGGGVAYAFEAVGSARVLADAYKATRRGGTTVTIGLAHPDQQLTIQAVSLVVEERSLLGSYMGSAVPKRDVPRYIGLFEAGKLPVDRLLSGTVELSDINAAFDALDRGDVVRQVLRF